VLLCEVWERTSAKGALYYSGYLANCSVVLLRDGERPHPKRPDETITVWKLLVSERLKLHCPRRSRLLPADERAYPIHAPPSSKGSAVFVLC
jgi:hypothetical protein